MKKLALSLVLVASVAFVSCKDTNKEANAIENEAEVQADAIENEAENQADALENEAEEIKAEAEAQAEEIKAEAEAEAERIEEAVKDRKSTRLNSSHVRISYAIFCLKKKKKTTNQDEIKIHVLHKKKN